MPFTGNLRDLVRQRLRCPHCGQNHGITESAQRLGVSRTALYRFLAGGGCSSDLIDRLVEWLVEDGCQPEVQDCL